MYLLIRYLNSHAADIPALPKVRYPRLSSCLAAALSFLPLIGCATDGKQDRVGGLGNGTMTAHLNTGTPGHPGFATQIDIGTGWNNVTRTATIHGPPAPRPFSHQS